MIPMARPMIGDEECAAVVAAMRSGQLAQGRAVAEFEARFAAAIGARHAVATSSGTTALHLALLVHGIGPGDEVITPAFSFIASANCALYVGATPVFADIDPETFNIDPDDIERKITERTRAIVAVHLYGNPAALDRIGDICRKHDLILIEDACQAHAATFQGQSIGTFGTACFSFYPTKNVTSGEGGIITTADDERDRLARLGRAHGMPQRYLHETLGYNFRMTDLHASIGLAQMNHLEEWTARRVRNANVLKELMSDLPLEFQSVLPGAEHVYHQFTVRIPEHRDAVAAYLKAHGVGCEIYYPLPIHQQPLYKRMGYDVSLPHTERAAQEVLSLPVHPSLSDADLFTVARTMREALAAVQAEAIAAR